MRRDVAGRVRAAQIAAVSRFSRFSLAANVCNAAVLLACFARSPLADVATMWTFAVVAVSLFVYLRGGSHSGQVAQYASPRGIRNALIYAAGIGSLWGTVPVLFFGGTPNEQLVVACLAVGMLCVGAFVLASIPLAATVFVVPIAIGTIIAMARTGELTYILIAFLMLSYVAVLLAAAISHASQMIARVIAQSEAEHAATLDSLTRLPNRTALLPALDEAVDRCQRFGEAFALLSIDLDGFKSVNDRFGHPAGDQLLTHVAARLASAVRGNDLLARVGGDEFALLARGVQTPAEAADLAERLLALFVAGIAVGGEEIRAALSIGIALAPSDGLVAATLLERSDAALYDAKNNGRCGFRLFQVADDRSIRRRKAWKRDLRKAVVRKEMHLEFQPILTLSADAVMGFEALLRWKHPLQGEISPVDFIPVAENTGLIREIGDFVIDEACRAAASWPSHIRVSVNFSLDQFRSLAIVDTVKTALERHALRPERFEVEVTESILYQNEPIVLQTLHALHEAGFRLVLDDFGTGFSSLQHVQDLPIDGIKIDRAFTSKLPHNPRSKAIVQSVVSLCRALGICVTAEGVETGEQLAALRALGCDEAQGYWLGRPQRDPAIAPVEPERRLVA